MLEQNPVFIEKAHQLVNAKFAFSLQENRVFLKLITLIKPEDVDFQEYSFKVSEFAKEFGIKSKDIYGEMEAVTDGLLKKIIKIPIRDQGKEKVFKTTLVSTFKYFKDGSGMIEATFRPELKPFLLQLKSRYLRYNLQNVLKLASSHCIRLYELLKQFETSGFRIIDLEELKELLGVAGKYERYFNFKMKILEYSKKKISEHTDITFDYHEIIEKRQVIKLHFHIRKKEKTTENIPVSQTVRDLIRRQKLDTDTTFIEWLTPRPEAVILEVWGKVEKQFKHILGRGMRIQNPSAYLRKLLMNQSLFEQTAQTQSLKELQVQEKGKTEANKKQLEAQLAEKTLSLREKYLTPELEAEIIDRLQKNPLLSKLLKDDKHLQAQIDRYLQKTYLTNEEGSR